MFKQKKKRSKEFKGSDKVIDFEQARVERREKRKEAAIKKHSKGRKVSVSELSERKISKRNRKRLIYSMVIIGIIAVISVSIFHVYLLQKEYEDIVAQNKELQKKRQDLTEELGNVNNPEYIEQQARQHLRMVKPGEILYILPAQQTSGAAVALPANGDLLPAGDNSD
ncbi:MAG: FtsB family cell division protein [Aminipila sp.]